MKLIFFFVGNPATRRDRIDPSFFPVCLSPFVSTFSSRKTLWVEWRRISADSAHLLNNPSEIQSCRSFFFYPMHLIIPNSSGNWRMFVCLFVVLIFVCWWMKAQEETRSRLFAAPLAGRVLLRNVTAAAEGVYKCEVSTEAPYFDTDYEEANLSVVGKSIIQISNFFIFPLEILKSNMADYSSFSLVLE